MTWDRLKETHRAVWGSAPYVRVAETLADMQDVLVERLGAWPGERWLDLASGTGAIAERAARAGADVTGVDLAPTLVETARRRAAEQGLDIRYEVGDAEALPFPDGAFDVVSSAVGVMFAPDREAAARELARVCRHGGRIGVTTWRPEGGAGDVLRTIASFQPPPPPGLAGPLEWGREESVAGLLGDAFELRFEELDAPLRAPSGQAAWELYSTSFGPTKTLVDTLEPERVEALREAFIAIHAEEPDAPVDHSRTYLLVLGTRR